MMRAPGEPAVRRGTSIAGSRLARVKERRGGAIATAIIAPAQRLAVPLSTKKREEGCFALDCPAGMELVPAPLLLCESMGPQQPRAWACVTHCTAHTLPDSVVPLKARTRSMAAMRRELPRIATVIHALTSMLSNVTRRPASGKEGCFAEKSRERRG